MTNLNFKNNDITKPKKLRQEITFKLSDGNILHGRIFVGYQESVLELLNDKRLFIPIELFNYQVILINKKDIIAVDSYHAIPDKSTKFENKIEESIIFKLLNNQHKNNEKICTVNKSNSNDKNECLDEIHESYEYIIQILNNPIFKQKRETDKKFNDNIVDIIASLRKTSILMEKYK